MLAQGFNFRSAFVCAIAVLLLPAISLALEPDEIALVVNAKVPEGRRLAELYARARNIPKGRIIELQLDPVSVSNPAEEMLFDAYEPQVAKPVRGFLERNGLSEKVKCLVTFWGVPLRIGRRTLTPGEQDELKQVQGDLQKTYNSVLQQTQALEQLGTQLAPGFSPMHGKDLGDLTNRVNAAVNVIVESLSTPDARAPAARFTQVLALLENLTGSPEVQLTRANPQLARLVSPPTPQEVQRAKDELAAAQRALAPKDSNAPTAEDRKRARQTAEKYMGSLGYLGILAEQSSDLQTDQSESALDSELSLIWWKGYARARFIENRLMWRKQIELHQAQMAPPPPTMMVTRLDAPSVPIVEKIIATSIAVEAKGLTGQVALDARGLKGRDAYGQYDQSIRDLADVIKQRMKNLQLTFDDKPDLIPAHTLKDIAIYCGWYSLRNYVPPGTFAEGAVGFHVGSFELISLRLPNEHGWVHGLLSDGVVGTIGSVAEPYLPAFPRADEFFPLLFTGKLTLAEVYWRTLPWTSWMMTCIGDPLYNPYKVNPPLKAADLPLALQLALEPPIAATQPSTQPATQPTSQPASQPATRQGG